MRTLSLQQLTILEADAFEAADITLLDTCKTRIAGETRFCLTESDPGPARLMNLIAWEADAGIEFLDEESVFADQIVHMGLHHWVHEETGSRSAADVLFGEALASGVDLYLVGKLAAAGEETEFLSDTLASFADFFEMYTGETASLEALVEDAVEDPFQTMLLLVRFLYQAGSAMLCSDIEQGITQLKSALAGPLGPLAHHYNLANWVLHIRGRFQSTDINTEIESYLTRFCKDEASFVHHKP